jgi:hypothetical protein
VKRLDKDAEYGNLMVEQGDVAGRTGFSLLQASSRKYESTGNQKGVLQIRARVSLTAAMRPAGSAVEFMKNAPEL